MRSTSSEVTYQDVEGRIDDFMTRFKMARLLNLSGIRKVRGISPSCVVRTVFQLAFIGRNIYTGVHTSATSLMGKDAVYRLLSSPRSNWRRLLGFLVQMVINTFLRPLTDETREKVLIMDTTLYDRNRSRRVELLSRVHDH